MFSFSHQVLQLAYVTIELLLWTVRHRSGRICKYLSCPTLLTRRKTSFLKKQTNKQTNKQTEKFIIVEPGFDEINNQARWCWKQSSEICLLVLSRACDKKTSWAPFEESNLRPSDSAYQCYTTEPQRLYKKTSFAISLPSSKFSIFPILFSNKQGQ